MRPGQRLMGRAGRLAPPAGRLPGSDTRRV